MAENQENRKLIPVQWIAENYSFLESASITFCIISYVLRTFDVEGAGLALGVSFIFYAGLIYLGAFIPGSYSLIATSIASRVCGIAGAITLIGLLFTFLHFPGAKSMLQIGSTTLLIAAFMLLALLGLKKDHPHLKPIIRSILLGLFGIAHLFLHPGLT